MAHCNTTKVVQHIVTARFFRKDASSPSREYEVDWLNIASVREFARDSAVWLKVTGNRVITVGKVYKEE